MLTRFDAIDGGLVKQDSATAFDTGTVWIDLLNPTKDEDVLVEKALGIAVPTREEMAEIEVSSRLYFERGAHYMTANILYAVDSPEPQGTAMTFILSGTQLTTVRYAEPRAFEIFLNRAQKKDAACMSGAAVMVGLLEAIIDREADRVERIQGEVDKLSQTIFGTKGGERTRTRRFDVNIRTIGYEGELTSRSRESLLSIDRLLTYLATALLRTDGLPAFSQTLTVAAHWLETYWDHVYPVIDEDAIARRNALNCFADPMAVVDEQRKLPQLQGIDVIVLQNQSENIRSSLGELRNAGLVGAGLALVVLFLFLRHWPTTLIVALAVPFSLLITVAAMYFLGFSLNILTMMGMLLAIGLLVDNAVVVTESIFRHRQVAGADPIASTLTGVTEVGQLVSLDGLPPDDLGARKAASANSGRVDPADDCGNGIVLFQSDDAHGASP